MAKQGPIDKFLKRKRQEENLIYESSDDSSVSDNENGIVKAIGIETSQDALNIIRNALSLPKLMYFFHIFSHIDFSKLGKFDRALRIALSSFSNIQLTDNGWIDLKEGIAMGCFTASTLFVSAMQVLPDAASGYKRTYAVSSLFD
ncbi:hypothetical protein HELRODRAFT_179154 [Helobdella robusta]|uniref:Uncharacterized protein n=1 Tax=Helobdella robusta TaxID=6412 RepID=T1FE97_HELRO|nr:hypothetical protein HELRODRAFT_179154 [Helobdella robusta]ESN95683.1 hypothetical protein HELRODRAFT_179154 [Helobdella robusta]